MNNHFQSFGVCAEILKTLPRMRIVDPTPVQSQTIRPFLDGKDLLVEAPTGTGKTCAFGIPIVQGTDRAATAPQTLILCPTRELALQTTSVLRRLAEYLPGVRVAAIYGGENIQRQFAALREKPQIIVATPGRLVDHIDRRSIDLSHIGVLVLDEADCMLDMGFQRDLNRILGTVPQQRQTALLSATLSGEIRDIATKHLHNPVAVRVARDSVATHSVKQYFAKVPGDRKNDELIALLQAKQYPLALVFVRTKRKAASLARRLEKEGLLAGALHGNMSQPQRDRMMKAFRRRKVNILVATDIAARGIDVKEIDAVINFDIPEDSDAYTHRIGRTGRAEHQGIALTFVAGEEMGKMSRIAGNRNIQVIPEKLLTSVI